jgi:hypothetical protein
MDNAIAKTILKAINSDNPDFRYLVGNDAVMTVDIRKHVRERISRLT